MCWYYMKGRMKGRQPCRLGLCRRDLNVLEYISMPIQLVPCSMIVLTAEKASAGKLVYCTVRGHNVLTGMLGLNQLPPLTMG